MDQLIAIKRSSHTDPVYLSPVYVVLNVSQSVTVMIRHNYDAIM